MAYGFYETKAKADIEEFLQGTYATLDSPTFTGAPKAPTAQTHTNTQQIATCAFVRAGFDNLHPVGSIFRSSSQSTKPTIGTWTYVGTEVLYLNSGGSPVQYTTYVFRRTA